MAEPQAHSQPLETYCLAPHNRNIWPSAHNRNIWPYNSQAAAAPSRLADSFVLQLSVYPLLLPLSQTVTLSRTPSPSSVTYFMDGPISVTSHALGQCSL